MTFINIFSLFFSEKIRLDVPSESSARQRIHMKDKALFLRKIKVKCINVVCCNFCLAFYGLTSDRKFSLSTFKLHVHNRNFVVFNYKSFQNVHVCMIQKNCS